MPSASSSKNAAPTPVEKAPSVPVRAIVAMLAVMGGAWIAAGSTGLLGHPLRHALTWIALAVAIVACWPRRDQTFAGWLYLAAAAVAGLIMTSSHLAAVNVLAVTLVAAALVRSPGSLRGRVLLIAGVATFVLAAFRLACTSIPFVWLAADACGAALGRLAAGVTGRPLSVGATFGGVDFLVLAAALYAGWLVFTAPPRLPRAIYAAAAILLAHLLYLVLLAYCGKLHGALPDQVLPEASNKSLVGVWAWGNAARAMLPWNLPAVGAMLHAAVAAAMFRWATWLPTAEPAAKSRSSNREEIRGTRLLLDASLRFGPPILAGIIPLLCVLALGTSSLQGKKIVAYENGYLDWERPTYDSAETGSYGMLPLLVESLGGEFIPSNDLSEISAQAADRPDLLLLIHPVRPWSEEQLDRVWNYVRDGGNLLVAAEPRIFEDGRGSGFNDVLFPTAMQVEHDTVVSGSNAWEQCYQTSTHPATALWDDGRNRFGLVGAASIRTGWRARPVLVGRWAYGDPGSDAAAMRSTYDPGERLGDLVLAAEARFGRGRVFVLGDVSCLHNEVNANSYPFTGRLLGYLAGGGTSLHDWWRQLLAALAVVGMIALLAFRASASRLALTAVVLAGGLAVCASWSSGSSRVIPDGKLKSPNNLAYIDASHLDAYCSDTWGEFGIGGLAHALMRSGYLPLLLPELTSERLEKARLLISIAPARRFSPQETAAVRQFVEAGGTFVCMVGSDRATGSRELLAEFEFHVRPSPVPPSEVVREPEPLGLGFFRQTFYSSGNSSDDYQAYVQTYASWQVECHGDNSQPLMLWSDGTTDLPFVVMRSLGRGTVVVVGDTFLAINQNLENARGPMPENVLFWRWFLTVASGQKAWIPPRPQAEAPAEVEPPPAVPQIEEPDSEPAGEDPRMEEPGEQLPLEEPDIRQPAGGEEAP